MAYARNSGAKFSMESMESRVLLSLTYGAEDVLAVNADARGGGAPVGPQIRLDLVALHEFGHSLGLDHTSDTSSIMYAYYNANYDLTKFASDSSVATFQTLFATESSRPWKDALDADGGVTDGAVTITYSFVRDGAKMDKGGSSNLFAAFDKKFGANQWEGIFVGELNRWAGVSNGKVQFKAFDADGIENAVYSFAVSGLAQNDSRFGDIRIAGHKFDGAGNVLGHTYYPPPNGGTAAGDSHYDTAENWILAPAPITLLGSDSFDTNTRVIDLI